MNTLFHQQPGLVFLPLTNEVSVIRISIAIFRCLIPGESVVVCFKKYSIQFKALSYWKPATQKYLSFLSYTKDPAGELKPSSDLREKETMASGIEHTKYIY